MGDNLLECYNPLYDVHLRQYFALPHMQKHLRNLGLLDKNQSANNANELHAGHLQMMDLMLRNRERVLAQLMDLQRKLDAAEKVELYRRIRSGITNAEELNRLHLSRSLSRPARSAAKSGRETGEGRKRRQSLSPEAGEMIKRVETDYRSDSAPFKNPKSIYNRLAANVYKYQYLHKLDDRTLHKYMNSLRKQLAKLERFREISFGPHTMARHQPNQLQQSWFFRRRSLPSLDADGPNHPPTQAQPQANAGRRSIKSGLGRKSRSGKSQSPHRANAFDGAPSKFQRTSISRTRGTQRLPPLPQSASNKKLERTFASPTQPNGKRNANARLPPTAVIRPTRKVQEQPSRRTVPISSAGAKIPAGKKTLQENRPASQKGSTTPVPVQKPPSASAVSGVLPAIGAALTGVAVGAGIASAAATMASGEEENRESGAPSPSISLAASQTTTTDGGQPGADSEWEGELNGGEAEEREMNGDTETRPTPEPFLEEKMAEGRQEILIDEEEEEDEGKHTARMSIHSQIQSPEEEQPPEEPEPPKIHYDEEEVENEEEMNVGHEEEETNVEEGERYENVEMTSAPFAQKENPDEEQPEEPFSRIPSEGKEIAPTKAEKEETTYPTADELENEASAEMVHNMNKEEFEQKPIADEEEHEKHNEEQQNEFGEMQKEEEELSTGRSKREVAFAKVEEVPKPMTDESSLNYYGKEEWSLRNKQNEEGGEKGEEQLMGEANSPIAASLDAVESERIRQFSHPNLEQETGPEESVRSLASSSIGGSMQREEENWPKSEENYNDHFGTGEEEKSNHEEPSNIGEEMEANYDHKFENESTNLMKDKQENEEVKHMEEIEKTENEEDEEDANENQHVQTPVQIEIIPSPENINWEEEGEKKYGGEKVEETEIISESIVVNDEKNINGNEMAGMEEEEERIEGRDEAASDAPQFSPAEAYAEIGNSGIEGDLDQENELKEIGIENAHETDEIKLKDGNLNQGQPQHDNGKEIEGFDGGNELMEQESEGKTFQQSSEHFVEQEEEMPKMDEASSNEELERVKREEQSPYEYHKEQQQSIDLVESGSVNADEDKAGRKLSGTDTQLGLEDGRMDEVENGELRDGTEIGHSTTEGLTENATLMDDQNGLEEMDGSFGAEENVERGSVVGVESHELMEDPTPMEEVIKSNEEDVIISEDLTGRSNERENAEEMENIKSEGEEEHQIEKEVEHHDEVQQQIEDRNESIVQIDVSSEHAEIISRPATGESEPQQQRNSLLSTQPSIEITPASEYGGSENGEMNSMQFSKPNSPQPKGIENEKDEQEEKNHKQQNEINLIEFDSSSPIAQEEFSKTDEMKEMGHQENGEENDEEHQQQQNRHKVEGDEEENKRTPLIIGEGGMEHGHGNGHLLMGGEGRHSSSSAETDEGADGEEERSEAEGSVVIHSETGGREFGIHQRNFQSVKLEDEDLID